MILSKEKAKELLLPFYPITSQNCLKAFRSLIDAYPEFLTYDQFCEIVLNHNKTLDKIAEQISNVKHQRRGREDAEPGYKKRTGGKNRGRKRDKVWDILKKADDILLLKHMDQWKALGVNNNKKWGDLCFKLSKSFLEGVKFPELPEYTGYSQEAISRMLYEQSILMKVIDCLKSEIDKASNNNSRVNKSFLNTIKKIWGEDIDFVLPCNMQIGLQRGQAISDNSIKRRNQRIRKIISAGNFKQFASGGKDYLDLKTRLCRLSHHVFILLILFHRWPLERQNDRLKAILKIQTLIKKYRVHPSELFGENKNIQNDLPSPGFGVGSSTLKPSQ